ncbi:MAG: hypothetical protein GX434_12835 [Peptococcaceae bacterium]|nr:hypothetical protein [Peptococcaceae bacterium]
MGKDKFLIIVHFLATGIVRWHKNYINSGKTYPYPDDVQFGLDKLACYSLTKNLEFPRNIPEAVQWFHQPLQTWPQVLENLLPFATEEALMIDNMPTDLCYELALEGDVEQELMEGLLVQVLNLCQEQGKNEDYVRFRRFIIENPILDRAKLIRWSNNLQNGVAARLLQDAYEDLPAGALGPEGKYYQCPHCGWILEWKNESEGRCIHQQCTEKTNNFKKRKVLAGTGLVRLKRGIMRFIAWPGRWELKLESDLLKLHHGLKVDLWPGFDSYDLRLTFPTGEVWGIDVKDWRNPYLLAKKAGVFPPYPVWDKAFWIIPDYQWRRYSHYGQEFGRFHKLGSNEFIESLGGFRRRVQRLLEVE